jgi:hypothetical protein
MKFSEIPLGTTFSGIVTSARSGQTIFGYFKKIGDGSTCLVEGAWDHEPKTESELQNGGTPYGRYIHPVVVVLVLVSIPSLEPHRVPLFLDDLEVSGYEKLDLWLSVGAEQNCSKDTNGDGDCGQPGCPECGEARTGDSVV